MTITNKEDFFNLITPVLAPSETLTVKSAYIFAKFGHRYQKRKERDENGQKIRYFEHVRRTAIILIDELKIYDPDLIASALLHDCIEDTRDVTAELIEYMFNTRIARIVRTLTNVPKHNYNERIANADKDTITIKFCDRLDNMRTIDHSYIDESFRFRKAKETVSKYIPIFNSKLIDEPRFKVLIKEMNDVCWNYLERSETENTNGIQKLLIQ